MATLQGQLSEYGEELLEKVPIDQWRNASKSDFNTIQEKLDKLTQSVEELTNKVDTLHRTDTKKSTLGVKKTTTKAKTTPKKNT
ncbi:MAG: hypothetical protein ACFB0A_14670 [Croceivirga sp.]